MSEKPAVEPLDLVAKWKIAARRDDVLNDMVPSDIRLFCAKIERLQARETELVRIITRFMRAKDRIAGDSYDGIEDNVRQELDETDSEARLLLDEADWGHAALKKPKA